MRPPTQALRRGVAVLLLVVHIGWASVKTWTGVDWSLFKEPRVDWITHVEPVFEPMREWLRGQRVVGYRQLPQEGPHWNVTTRFQLQYMLAPVLLDKRPRTHPMTLVEQQCVERQCTPGPDAFGAPVRDTHLGMLVVGESAP